MAIFPTLYFLKEDEQLFIEGLTTRRVIQGPGRVIVPALHQGVVRKATVLAPTEYLLVRDTLTGELRNEIGPKLFFPSASDEIVQRRIVTTLKNNQYMKLIDRRTGVVRVEIGEQALVLNPYEDNLTKVEEGINIDEHHAVVVRDTETGQLELITKLQVFFPSAKEEVVNIPRRILLEDHDTVVIKNKDGGYVFRRGTDTERSFFLDPYSQVVEFRWSSGLRKEKRELKLTHIDSRPKYMWYEFDVRTQDNVELVIGITFFWQIVDVEKMIKTTDDTSGDVCAHARSKIIQAVSRVLLEDFLANFNVVVGGAVLQSDDFFYSDRGVQLLAVEVRSISCKDPGTQQVLQEIIQETTNRLNRLQKQESENEVKLRQVVGEIDVERQRAQLLEIRRENERIGALTEGEAEAQKLRTFLDGLGEDIPLENRIALFNTLRKSDIFHALSKGKAQLYFTPSDVNLSIDTNPSS